MIVAGFDLGAHFGAAFLDQEGKRLFSCTMSFGKRTSMSLVLVERFLYSKLMDFETTVVGYEAVKQHHRSRAAACAYGSYEAVLWIVCENLGIPVVPVNVQEVKKLALVPNPDKEDMEAAAKVIFNHITHDDNEADALLVAEVTRRKMLNE